MPGSWGSPYRPPGGLTSWPANTPMRGGRYQHYRTAENGLARWDNESGVAPRSPCVSEALSCDTAQSSPPCGPWLPEDKPECTAADATHAIIDGNCYTKQTGEVIDAATCIKVGFKNAQSRKVWHGRFGWRSHDPGGRTNRIQDPDGASCTCDSETEQPDADGTKYLNVEYACTWHQVYSYNGVEVSDTTEEITRSMAVDEFGRLTADGSGEGSAAEGRMSAYVPGDAGNAKKLWDETWAFWITQGITPTWSRTGAGQLSASYTSGANSGSMSVDLEAGTFSAEYNFTDYAVTLSMTCSNTVWTISSHVVDGNNSGSLYDTEWTLTGTLSVPYTEEDVRLEVEAMLNEWPLNDDALYPWRHDTYCSIAPLVTYDEVPEAVWPEAIIAWDTLQAYADPNWDTYSGDLRGSPLTAGYGPHFDWRHRTWTEETPPARCVVFHGAYSGDRPGEPNTYTRPAEDVSDAYMPATATQWTENDATWDTELPCVGAWVRWKTGVCWAQKWAEAMAWAPSQNFARPFGPDRITVDQETVRCCDASGGTITVESATAIDTGDAVLVKGVSGISNGWYSATKTGALTYTVSALAVAMPGGETYEAGAGWMGKARFPDAPGIGGRLEIIGASNAIPIVIETRAAHYLRDGDEVDISDVLGNTAANGTAISVTVVDGTHFSLNGTTGNGSYTGGGFASVNGAPGYQWNDDQSKGDFVEVRFGFNYRDYVERDRVIDHYDTCPDCSEAAPDDDTPLREQQVANFPSFSRSIAAFQAVQRSLIGRPDTWRVAYCSPQDEGFQTAHWATWPTVAGDDRYGALGVVVFQQTFTDALWQSPARPCVECDGFSVATQCGWVDDNGSCDEDTCADGCEAVGNLYFAHAPMVEARTDLPVIGVETAPDMPAGCEIHVLTLAEIQSVSPAAGVVLYPPGSGVAGEQAWSLWWAQRGCVCVAGRFAGEYGRQRHEC